MKILQYKILIVAVCVMGIFGSGLTLCKSPGAALLDRGKISSDKLEASAACVLWINNDWIIVSPGSHPEAKSLVSAKEDMDLYLFGTKQGVSPTDYSKMGTVIPIDSSNFLLELPADQSGRVVLPENAVYLGYPVTIHANGSTVFAPVSITWDSQVQGIVDTISQDQLMTDLTALVDFETRQSYTQQCRDAASWLGNEYETMGYAVTYHEHDRAMAPNVIAEKTGVTTPEEIVIVCGHFDSVSLQAMTLAPGADDNGTGTAATLTAARVMANKHFNRTIRFIAFSGEEQGLRGSQAYAQRAAQQGENIVGVVNLDMIGYVHEAPGDLEVIGNSASASLVDLFIDCSLEYTNLATNRIINGNITASDHAPFWIRGYPAILGIEDYPVRYPYYHTIDDTVDKVTPEFVLESTRAAVATAAHLAEPMMEVVYIFTSHLDDSAGDNDGYLDPNETVEIWVEIMNNSDQVSGPLQLNLLNLTGSQYVIVLNNSMILPELLPGERADNRDNPYVIQVRAEVPEFSQLTSIATLSCDAPHSSGYFINETFTSYNWQDSIVLFDMDEDPGWTASDASWEWGIPTGSGGADYGHPDPTAGFTGNHVLGNNLNGDYEPNIYTTVTSPNLDLTDVRFAELQFERWLNVESPVYDQARVWIINEDANHLVWENASELMDNHWQTVTLDVSEYADGRSDVRIMFSLETDGGWEYSGWNIDDVRIAGLAPGDPLPTPTPSLPPDSLGVLLTMPDTVMETSDPFELTLQSWNTTVMAYTDIPLIIVLDIANAYWFWPDWTADLTYETRPLPSDTVGTPEIILDFIWPEVAGSASGLRFWAAFTTTELTEVLGSFATIEWEYR